MPDKTEYYCIEASDGNKTGWLSDGFGNSFSRGETLEAFYYKSFFITNHPFMAIAEANIDKIKKIIEICKTLGELKGCEYKIVKFETDNFNGRPDFDKR